MTLIEQEIWKHVMCNPDASVEEIARTTGYSIETVALVMSKSGSAEPERIRLLKRGIELTGGDRNKTYGDPWDNLTACAQLWEAYLSAKLRSDVCIVAEDVAHMMQLVKMTRTFYGEYHADNYLDNAVYGAIAGECRQVEEQI
jgi:hypothetical protein